MTTKDRTAFTRRDVGERQARHWPGSMCIFSAGFAAELSAVTREVQR
jgi:hypothetical protein